MTDSEIAAVTKDIYIYKHNILSAPGCCFFHWVVADELRWLWREL